MVTSAECHSIPYCGFSFKSLIRWQILFGTLRNREQFATEGSRLEFISRLNSISSVQIDESRISGYPKIRFTQFQSDADVDRG